MLSEKYIFTFIDEEHGVEIQCTLNPKKHTLDEVMDVIKNFLVGTGFSSELVYNELDEE